MNKEEAALEIAELIQQKSDFQERVGRLVLSVQEQYGKHQVEDLHEMIKEQGVVMSASTLRQYAWVAQSSDELGLPPDLDFSTKRMIINSPHKDKYLKLLADGYSAAQLKREIAIDNSEAHTKCTGYCKFCNKEVDVKHHNCQEKKVTDH